MIPENVIASSPRISGFSYPVKQPGDFLVDWELAGVALNDPSQGLAVKLWKLEALYNETTGLRDVTVSAPGVTPTVLFSGVGVTEVALAFDQNMNPFVAYTQSGAPKIYWYDPLIPGMTTTVLPAGCYDLRACLDEKRAFDVANSDVILSYIRSGNLCVRCQRDRYGIEYVLKSGLGAGARLVSAAMNLGSRLQWRVRGYTLSDPSGALVQETPYLAEVALDVLGRSGMQQDQIDVSELWVPIEGYKIATESGADAMLAPLQQAFFFDPYESDKKLRFKMRAEGTPVARITADDFLEAEGRSALEKEIVQGLELLRKVNVVGTDSSIDYVDNKQTAERISATVKARGEQSFAVPITGSPDFFATIAMRKIKVGWGEILSLKFAVPVKFSWLTPSDIIEVEDKKGALFTMRIMQIEEDGGRFMLECVEHAAWAYGVEAEGVFGEAPTSTTPGLVGDTQFEILNIPVQRDQEDELGLTVVGNGMSNGWYGYSLLVSFDGGVNYSTALTSQDPANIGELVTPLAPGGTSVEVLVPYTLESVALAAITAGQNRAIIGQEEVQYQTATLIGMSGDLYHYGLSGIVRGILGTAEGSWAAGTRFVELDSAVQFLQIQRTYYDTDVHYKAVSLGASSDSVAPTVYHLKPMVNQTELAVTGLTATAVSSAVKVDWANNPRLGTFGTPFNSKYFAGYRVKFSDGYSVDTTNTTLTYSTPPPGGTVQVCQLNQITGEGPFVSVPIPIIGFRVTEAGDRRITETGDYRITE